jgi:ABC-2 type transport system permease protein
MNTTTAWLIRREFWENRAIWMIPAVFGGLMIVATLFGQISLPTVNSPAESHEFGGIFLVVIGLMFYLVMSLYAGWYLLDCLYADRKDRSILFWKSLPISDAETVWSKLLVGLVLVPLVYFVAADVTALITAFIISIRARASIGNALWHLDVWTQIQVLWLYVILSTAVWYLPVAGWLLLVSAWAKRAVILWSILPPLALYIVERVFFSTHVIGDVLHKRLMGLPSVAYRGGWTKDSDVDLHSHLPSSVWNFIDAGGFFSNVQTWIGAAVGVALIVAAIELRRRRAEV